MTKEAEMKKMLEAALASDTVKENVFLNIDPFPLTNPGRTELSIADKKGFFPGVYIIRDKDGTLSISRFGVISNLDRHDSYVSILETYREYLTPGLAVIELTKRWGWFSQMKLKRVLKRLNSPMTGKTEREEMSHKLEEVLGSENLGTVLDEKGKAIRLAYKNRLKSWATFRTPNGLYLNNSLMRVDESSNPIANVTQVSTTQAAAYLHKRGKTPQSLNKRLAEFGL